ncbi:unnamed protein product [Amaranthus hypochondriacus]
MSASTASGSANSRRRPAAASDMNEDLSHSSQLPNRNEKSPKPGWMTLFRYLWWSILLGVFVRVIMEGRIAKVKSSVDDQSKEFDAQLEKLNKRIGDLELRLNELKSKGFLTKDDIISMYGELKRSENDAFAGLSYDDIRHSVRDDVRTMFRDAMEIMGSVSIA